MFPLYMGVEQNFLTPKLTMGNFAGSCQPTAHFRLTLPPGVVCPTFLSMVNRRGEKQWTRSLSQVHRQLNTEPGAKCGRLQASKFQRKVARVHSVSQLGALLPFFFWGGGFPY